VPKYSDFTISVVQCKEQMEKYDDNSKSNII